MPNSIQVRNLVCNCFVFLTLLPNHHMTLPLYYSFLTFYMQFHIKTWEQAWHLILISSLILSWFKSVDFNCFIVIWRPHSVRLIQNQWFSFGLHTCFDSQNRWVKYKIMYLHNFCNKKCEKRIHKTGCWNIPAKFDFFLCRFGKHKHWIWTPDCIVSLYFGVGLSFISALCLGLSLHQGCERFVSFYFSFFYSPYLTENLILNLFDCKQIPVSPFSKWSIHTCSETQSPDVLIMSKVETVMAVTFFLHCMYLSYSAKHLLLW